MPKNLSKKESQKIKEIFANPDAFSKKEVSIYKFFFDNQYGLSLKVSKKNSKRLAVCIEAYDFCGDFQGTMTKENGTAKGTDFIGELLADKNFKLWWPKEKTTWQKIRSFIPDLYKRVFCFIKYKFFYKVDDDED